MDTKTTLHSLASCNQVTPSSEDLQDLGGSEGRKVEVEGGVEWILSGEKSLKINLT